MFSRTCVRIPVMLGMSMGMVLACAPAAVADLDLAEYRAMIRPSDEELSFESIGWKPTFWEAVTEAQATGKPILLWAMNGHPLACT